MEMTYFGFNGWTNKIPYPLKYLLLNNFCPHDQGSLVEQWLAVRQEGRVAEYYKEFVEKMSPLGKIPIKFPLEAFVNGLKKEIRCELRLMDPNNLKMTMEWAEKIEHKG